MKLEDLGHSAQCSRCHKTYPSDRVMFEGPELEPICLPCLLEVDKPRADILTKIQSLRRPTGPVSPPGERPE